VAIAIALVGVGVMFVRFLVTYLASFSPDADELAWPATAPIAFAIRGLFCGIAAWLLLGMWRHLGEAAESQGVSAAPGPG
jgi:hypothetical protein